jgi:O-antigen ligase
LFYALAVWFFISALSAGDFMEGLTKYSGNVMIAAIVFVLVSNAPREDDDVVLLRRSFVVAVCGLIAHAILVTTSQQDYDPTLFRLEDAGTVGNSNDLASLITVAVPFVAVPALMSKGRRSGWATKLGILLAILVLFAGLSASQSRGAILSLALGGIVFGVLRARNKALAIVAAAFCVIAVIASSSLLTFSREADDLEGSTKSRMAFMMAGINMGLHHPILGIGHDGFATAWDAYAVGETYESGTRSGHSSWLIAFAENGIPGLLLLVALFVSSFRKAVSVQLEHPELVCAMVSYGVAMTFLNHAYTIYPYLLFALTLAAARIHAKGASTLLKGQNTP